MYCSSSHWKNIKNRGTKKSSDRVPTVIPPITQSPSDMLPTAPALTLIPYSEGGHTLDSSVRYSTEDVTVALRRIERFLLDQGIDKSVVFSVMLCCEELMVNIVQHSTGHIVSHTFDVHVFVKDGMVQIAVKDGGRPFDPIARGKAAKLKLVDNDIPDLGVSIAANIVSDISYKYMYGQNMVLIKV
jgi:anti-sigma regulatory factor (Ser/Thr protein kinase)